MLIVWQHGRLHESLPARVLPVGSLQVSQIPVLVGLKLFALEKLAVGWLWLRFDYDSLNAVKNYHRLLAILDLIILIQPDEFEARGLAATMRVKRLLPELREQEGLKLAKELIQASSAYPQNDRGFYEVAYLYTFILRKPDMALPFAQKAIDLKSSTTNEKLYLHLQKLLKLNIPTE